MDPTPERLLMAFILSQYGGEDVYIPIGALLEAQIMGGYRVHDHGDAIRIQLVHDTTHRSVDQSRVESRTIDEAAHEGDPQEVWTD